jgi:hypothetical protein
MTLPPLYWEQIELEKTLRRAVHTGENLSRKDLEGLVKVCETLTASQGALANEEIRRSFLYRVLERREKERDAYQHALEVIVRQLRANQPNQPSIEAIALEALALPDDELLKARIFWENRIIEAAENVPVSADSHDWMHSPEFGHYIGAWLDLEKFHE